MRSILLAASQNQWLRHRAVNYSFVKHTVSRFMPGETLEDALRAADLLQSKKIGTVFTHLGENIRDRAEAQQVAEHYLEVLKRIREKGLQAEISVKLTQLGLDLSRDLCFEHFNTIIERAQKDSTVWVDMEASNYVEATLELYRRALTAHPTLVSACKLISTGQEMTLRSFCRCGHRFDWSKARITSRRKSRFPAGGTSTKAISSLGSKC